MALTNADRQRRFRERKKALGSVGIASLPEFVAGLPTSDDPETDCRAEAAAALAEMTGAAVRWIEFLTDQGLSAEAKRLAKLFGVNLDPLGGLTFQEVYAAAVSANVPKADIRGFNPGSTLPVPLSTAYACRPLLEKLGLWRPSA